MNAKQREILREFVRLLPENAREAIDNGSGDEGCDFQALLSGEEPLLSGEEMDSSASCWRELLEACVPTLSRSASARLLTDLLEASNGDRIRLIELLGESGSKRAIGTLAPLLRKGETVGERLAAVYSIKLIQDERIVPHLIWRLADPEEDSSVRAEAACALGEVEALEAAALLRTHLRDSAPILQFWAAYALGSLGDTRALPALVELADHGDDARVFDGINTLRGEARWAIDAICESPRQLDEPQFEDGGDERHSWGPLFADPPRMRDSLWFSRAGCHSPTPIAIEVWGRSRSECAALTARILFSARSIAPALDSLRAGELKELGFDLAVFGTTVIRGTTLIGDA